MIKPATGDARHSLHAGARIWPESNCYVDLWIGLLHAASLDPVPMLVCALGSHFDVDQWTFCKPSALEIATLYGVRVEELNIWWHLQSQVQRQVDAGRVVLVETDSFFLPDTAATTYQRNHGKTTIGIHHMDATGRELAYLHNAGAFTLRDTDFDGIFSSGVTAATLPPFAEFADFTLATARTDEELRARAADLANQRLMFSRADDAFDQWADIAEQQLNDLASGTIEFFHAWAFGTVRQAGAMTELLGVWCASMGADAPWQRAAALFVEIAQSMAAQQFRLARVSGGGRRPDLVAALRTNAPRWREARQCVRDGIGLRTSANHSASLSLSDQGR